MQQFTARTARAHLAAAAPRARSTRVAPWSSTAPRGWRCSGPQRRRWQRRRPRRPRPRASARRFGKRRRWSRPHTATARPWRDRHRKARRGLGGARPRASERGAREGRACHCCCAPARVTVGGAACRATRRAATAPWARSVARHAECAAQGAFARSDACRLLPRRATRGSGRQKSGMPPVRTRCVRARSRFARLRSARARVAVVLASARLACAPRRAACTRPRPDADASLRVPRVLRVPRSLPRRHALVRLALRFGCRVPCLRRCAAQPRGGPPARRRVRTLPRALRPALCARPASRQRKSAKPRTRLMPARFRNHAPCRAFRAP